VVWARLGTSSTPGWLNQLPVDLSFPILLLVTAFVYCYSLRPGKRVAERDAARNDRTTARGGTASRVLGVGKARPPPQLPRTHAGGSRLRAKLRECVILISESILVEGSSNKSPLKLFGMY